MKRMLCGASLLVLGLAPVSEAQVSVPNTFVNGTASDANEVNANFDALKTGVNANASAITAAQSTADAAALSAIDAQGAAATADAKAVLAQSAADAASSAAAAAASTADAAQLAADGAVGQGIASIQINSAGVLEMTLSDGTVLNAGTVSVPSSPALAQGAWNSAIWGPTPNGGVWQ
jgi:outer membrane murein-binding lipoprotein Lpp